MAEGTDGVGETFDDSLRIARTIASQFGERFARLREQLARQREASATQEARELEARFEAERGAARASLAPVAQPEWWDRASPEDIAGGHETATAWRDFDDVARDASGIIKHEVQERYGIDIDSPERILLPLLRRCGMLSATVPRLLPSGSELVTTSPRASSSSPRPTVTNVTLRRRPIATGIPATSTEPTVPTATLAMKSASTPQKPPTRCASSAARGTGIRQLRATRKVRRQP